jgi:hypothetical protein
VNTVCLVPSTGRDGLARLGSYARSGKAPPARTADGLLTREKVEPGRGDAGNESMLGKRLTLGLGDDGSPTRLDVDFSDTADTGSASLWARLDESAETERDFEELSPLSSRV